MGRESNRVAGRLASGLDLFVHSSIIHCVLSGATIQR